MKILHNTLGYILGTIFRYRYQVSLQNISKALPHSSYEQINTYHSAFYQHLGRLVLEGLTITKQKLSIDIASLEVLQHAKKQHKSIIVLLGHFGNWEAITQLPLHVDIPVQALYQPLKNLYWNKKVKSIRQRHGLHLIPAQQGLRTLLKQQGKPSLTLFVADQFPRGSNRVTINFLNQPTRIFTGAEQIAQKLDAYVLYAELLPKNTKEWELKLYPICQSARETSPHFISKTFFQKLEDSIKKQPHLWLWSHRRWKQ